MALPQALALKWDDIDFAHESFIINKTKNKKPHTLPITSYTLKLFEALKTHRINDYVFPSPTSSSGNLEEPRKSIILVNKNSNTDVTVHDLRRTFTTVANNLNLTPYTIKRLINHSLRNDVTAIYIQGEIEDLRLPLQMIQDSIIKLSKTTSEQLLTSGTQVPPASILLA